MTERIYGKKTIEINNAGIARTFQNIRLFSNLSVADIVKAALHHKYSYSLLEGILHLGKNTERWKRKQRSGLMSFKVFELDQYAEYKASQLPYGKQRKLEIARALPRIRSLLFRLVSAAGMNPQETKELILTFSRTTCFCHM